MFHVSAGIANHRGQVIAEAAFLRIEMAGVFYESGDYDMPGRTSRSQASRASQWNT